MSSVDPSLATDRGIDHGQQGRGDMNHADSAMPQGCRKPADIGHESTTNCHDHVVTRGSQIAESIEDADYRLERLRRF